MILTYQIFKEFIISKVSNLKISDSNGFCGHHQKPYIDWEMSEFYSLPPDK